jgi:hypothetical protein
MLAKTKLEALKKVKSNQELDKKILEAIELDLIDKKEINESDVPKDLKTVLDTYVSKVLKSEAGEEVSYYLVKESYDSKLQKTVREYTKVSLVEDFDLYYEEIKLLLEDVKEKKTHVTYNFIMTFAWIICSIGLISGIVMISEAVLIGLGTIISTSAFSAILFGIANIIKLLNDKK